MFPDGLYDPPFHILVLTVQERPKLKLKVLIEIETHGHYNRYNDESPGTV